MTIEMFVRTLFCQWKPGENCSMEDAVKRGWLTDYDLQNRFLPLNRQTMARIVHQFLRIEQKEADEEDWNAAKQLLDLYDCRTCVNHVAQLYVKGIVFPMQQNGQLLFGMQKLLAEKEAEQILGRVFNPAQRVIPLFVEDTQKRARCITCAEADALLQAEKEILLVDVREKTEYDTWHKKGAVSMPLIRLLGHQYDNELKKEQKVLLYCEQGYRSRMAANYLMEHDYRNVYYFASDNRNGEVFS